MRAGLVVLSTVLSLVAVELYMRRIAPPAPPMDGFLDPESPLDGIQLHRNRSTTVQEFGRTIALRTNGLGLRDRDHEIATEGLRVAFLGDSFTYGLGVHEHERFTDRIDVALGEALPSISPAVHNVSISGIGQVHEELLLREVWSEIRPHVVVLMFCEDNDIDENLLWNPRSPGNERVETREELARKLAHRLAVADTLYRHSAIVRFLRHHRLRESIERELDVLERWAVEAGEDRQQLIRGEVQRRFLQAFATRFDDDWEVTELLLDRIRQTVEQSGARFVLARAPSRFAVDMEAWDRAVEIYCAESETLSTDCDALDRDHTARRLASYAASRDVLFIDPGVSLSSASRDEDLYYPLPDIHWTALGHARVAEVLAAQLIPLLREQSHTR